MTPAHEIFNKLKSFGALASDSGSPESEFQNYCTGTLSSVEGFHFDFKESGGPENGQLGATDKKNLAKAVSGFANSGGGVLIWGVQDKCAGFSPIPDIAQFMNRIANLVPMATDPPVQSVDTGFLQAKDDPKAGFGFVLIPESSLPPHRVILNDNSASGERIKNQYFQRTSDSFVVASHSQLEDMFGRRPSPRLELSAERRYHKVKKSYPADPDDGAVTQEVRCIFSYVILISNVGRGVAVHPYVEASVNHPHALGSYWSHTAQNPRLTESRLDSTFCFDDESKPKFHHSAGRFWGEAGQVIHSETSAEVAVLKALIPRPKEACVDVVLRYRLAASGMRTSSGELTICATALHQMVCGEMDQKLK